MSGSGQINTVIAENTDWHMSFSFRFITVQQAFKFELFDGTDHQHSLLSLKIPINHPLKRNEFIIWTPESVEQGWGGGHNSLK